VCLGLWPFSLWVGLKLCVWDSGPLAFGLGFLLLDSSFVSASNLLVSATNCFLCFNFS
jgi:hypothetical protein